MDCSALYIAVLRLYLSKCINRENDRVQILLME
jgi:hypothetical protein